MRIKSMRVENFRSIRGATLEFDGLTALVGANGAGKSTFLQALLVFQGRQKVAAEDFYGRNTGENVEIAVTFTGLPDAAAKKFAKYVRDGELEVVRVCRHNDGAVESALHGASLSNRDFGPARSAPRARDMLDEYNRLREKEQYGGLPKCSSMRDARAALDEWERDNPDKCERATDDGRFFGFEEVAAGYLGQFIRILYVPAVREASGDGAEGGRGSVLHELLELTVRGALAESALHIELQGESDALYEKARKMGDTAEAKRLEDDINGTLGMLAKGARVDLEWSMQAPRVGLPTATVRLAEDGYSTTIDRTGHGLQRSFIIAMLGCLHGAQAARAAPGEAAGGGEEKGEGGGDTGPSVMLAIEEPELHQHPSQARHIAGLLSSISVSGFAGVANDVQVAYTTHSPHFVGADRIGQLRLVRKAGGKEGMPGETRVRSTGMDNIQERLRNAGASSHADPEKLRRDFDRILTPLMSEGFFARTAVLVEGDSDRVAILRAAEMRGTPLDERGVAVIPCGSKAGIHGPLAMFMELGVRAYPVWDRDGHEGKEKGLNDRLLSLVGRKGGDCPDATTAEYSCLGAKLEGALRSDMGEEMYDRLVAGYRNEYSLKKKDDKKPLVTHLLMEEMERRGIRPTRLERIVEAILAGDGAERGGSA